MGEPVRIDDLARRMVEQAASPVPTVYTGLRRGGEAARGRTRPGRVRPSTAAPADLACDGHVLDHPL
ncbi:hypothetical protein ACIBTW_25730 [Micromonospora parva]|uniref:hypothetical protein n=1 Tax=Micromonospora parva TaxID=1464048 RepID=UPI0037B67372